MGSAITKHRAYKSFAEELSTLKVRDVLERLRSSRVDVVFHEEGAEHLTHESRVRDHLSLIARKEGIAVFHAETRVFMGVIDTFTLLAYLLRLFGDATEQRTVVEERPDPLARMGPYGGMYGIGYGGIGAGGTMMEDMQFNNFITVRQKSFVSDHADGILKRGALFFQLDTAGDVLQKCKELGSVHSGGHVEPEYPLMELLSSWGERGLHNVVVCENSRFGVITESDALFVLDQMVTSHQLDLGDVKIKRLGLAKTMPKCVKGSTRLMHALRIMLADKISAVPIVHEGSEDFQTDKRKMKLWMEVNLNSLSRLNADNFDLILQSCDRFVISTDPTREFSTPAKCSRRDSLQSVIDVMVRMKRTHVWAVTKKNNVKGVVSLRDIFAVVYKHVKK